MAGELKQPIGAPSSYPRELRSWIFRTKLTPPSGFEKECFYIRKKHDIPADADPFEVESFICSISFSFHSQKLLKKNENGAQFSIEVIPNFELEQLFLSYGENLEVKKTDHLKTHIKKRKGSRRVAQSTPQSKAKSHLRNSAYNSAKLSEKYNAGQENPIC